MNAFLSKLTAAIVCSPTNLHPGWKSKVYTFCTVVAKVISGMIAVWVCDHEFVCMLYKT